MPSIVDPDDFSKSLLAFVTQGKYPESEDTISAQVTLDVVPNGLQDISTAREKIEEEINVLSRDTASDVDGWISQARQLRVDIEKSRQTARNIIAQHERTQPLRAQVEDAAAKVQLLNTELAFNEGVTNVLEEVQKFSEHISKGRDAVQRDQINEALLCLQAAENFMNDSPLMRFSNVANLVGKTHFSLRESIVVLLKSRWADQIRLSKDGLKICPQSSIEEESPSFLMRSLSELEILDSVTNQFQDKLLEYIMKPVLLRQKSGQNHKVLVDEDGVHVGELAVSSVSEVTDCLTFVFRYLQEHLPTSLFTLVIEPIMPTISKMLCENWLSPSIPLDLEAVLEYEKTLVRITDFHGTIEKIGLRGHEELVSWVNQFSRLWLTRRRVDALDQVRKILVLSKGNTKKAERIEKETVTNKNDFLLDAGSADDWNDNWADESEEETKKSTTAPDANDATAEDDADVDAWGLGEDKMEETADTNEEENGEDAWGWDEDVGIDDDNDAEKSVNQQPKGESKDTHTGRRKPDPVEEITLKEYYTITDIPDSIIALIQRQIVDSASLATPKFSSSRVAASGNALLALPTLIVAMFKAIASSFYSLKLNSGNIYLYNDSLYLAEEIRKLVEQHGLDRLNPDAEGLERFGKLSYSKEMQMQRTIVTDLLDGSQGFVQCSQQPFLRECENAIDATVDRFRSVFKEWQPILSHSALLQAMGSLLGSVLNKMIIDIEDLSDISEAESQSLVTFCNKIATLEDIFIPEPNVGTTSMAAVYVRNWFKFQYLINILESSLADIKFLWTEGELHLEFSSEEVVELILALFAESEHRRRTISEIRRSHR